MCIGCALLSFFSNDVDLLWLFTFFVLGRHTDSIDDLRELYDQKERKIKRKRIMYETFREKLSVSFFNTLWIKCTVSSKIEQIMDVGYISVWFNKWHVGIEP